MVWNTRKHASLHWKELRIYEFGLLIKESDVVGFISLSYSSEDCAEIDCLGVKSHSKIKELEGN